MTVLEIAKQLNITSSDIYEFFRKRSGTLTQDENYVLTSGQIRRLIARYNLDGDLPELTRTLVLQSKPETQLKGLKNPIHELNHLKPIVLGSIDLKKLKALADELKTKRIEILDNLEPYFKKGEGRLLNEIMKHNSIPNLLLEGDYKMIEGNNFGFFKNISHQNGTFLNYPVSNDLVDEIFISSGDLKSGMRYSFEATIARLNQRTKKANPFLLLAKDENIKEIVAISAISQELKVKEEKLRLINTDIEKAEENFERRKEEIAEEVTKDLQEKQIELDSIIEQHQHTIDHKLAEIQKKEKELSFLSEKFEETKNHLKKMESLINTLKDRALLCRNLQFISASDEEKYLNLLTAKEFNPVNHHDFEIDFEKNFSKLADHIHAYLYHEKNLIYTSYQIKNFLTLLRTHDLIVLSGLSGSGKTQIVKAFAEALGGVAKIIPVKPNWTSSDDLIGYYNPLQMSFLPTPFTEAIVEAINNPNQLYLICLDEMNLARVEYYFADFLSKLEERSKPPEIELYAKHEEELFVSEFNTLLNLIESSLNGAQIGSWQAFLDNDDVRKKFFEMLGNTDKESMLQIHTKMKRRLIDILKFPSTIRIPDNVRFIGAINVDETTHYFSPKILDRIHVVKFDNPLLFEEQVNNWFENTETEKELKPVYVQPNLLSERKELPAVNNVELTTITQKLKEINQKFLLPLNIDFGIRSVRQSLNFTNKSVDSFEYYIYTNEEIEILRKFKLNNDGTDIRYIPFDIALNSIVNQKILPRFIFDGSEISKNGKSKMEVVEDLQKFLSDEFNEFFSNYESDETDIGKSCSEYLEEMIKQANRNNSQFNFFA